MRFIRERWLSWNLRRAASGDRAAMNRLYSFRDPWGLNTPGEHFRFQETARIIREKVRPSFGSILEIGCGEGLQTEYFASMGGHIQGVDPSENAIQRARRRGIGNASFEIGDLLAIQRRFEQRFDLVTACEVLYYLTDFEQAYQILNRLGRACVVTYYRGVFERLDSFFRDKLVASETIRGATCEWRLVYWGDELRVD